MSRDIEKCLAQLKAFFEETSQGELDKIYAELDEWNLWAARTKDGGWFTFDIQSTWQSGRLDIDGTLIEWMKKEYNGEYPINDDNVE